MARVFQILDCYDALCSARPYKRALPRQEVMAIMADETAKGLWDPKLMAIFLDMVRDEPETLKSPAGRLPTRELELLRALSGNPALDQLR